MNETKERQNNEGKIWLIVTRFLVLAQIISFFVGGFFIYSQWKFLEIQRKDLEANISEREIGFVQDFDADLRTGTNGKIVLAILKNKPVLKSNGGNFTTDDINHYLSFFQILYSLVNRKLIGNDLTYIFFSEIITKTYNNKEIQEHLQDVRKVSLLFYRGLDVLASRSQELSNYFGGPAEVEYYQKKYDSN